MTIAIDQPIEQKQLSFDEFLARYCGDNRYELIDGEVFDLEPTGLHEEVAAFITTKVCVQIDKTNLPWFVLQRGLLRPSHLSMTAFRPDVAVVDRDELSKELLWSNQSILTPGSSIKFVADYAGLGGTRHIGKPKQPTLSICTLVDGEYEIQQFRGNQTITSTIFPGLKLTAEQVLRAGG